MTLKDGYYYRFIGNSRPYNWNDQGEMDLMLDGKARKYHPFREGSANVGSFEGIPEVWGWGYGNWEECGLHYKIVKVLDEL